MKILASRVGHAKGRHWVQDQDGEYYSIFGPEGKILEEGREYNIEFTTSKKGDKVYKNLTKIEPLEFKDQGGEGGSESPEVVEPEIMPEGFKFKERPLSIQETTLTPTIVESMLQLQANEKDPTDIIADAVKKAKALKDIIDTKKDKIIINGKQYLDFQLWQTLGKFYGLSVRTGDAVPFTRHGIRGALAKGYVHFFGVILSSAEAYCMEDEKNWRGKPWFQLASMAQTRAGAKALRNKLGWVAVLAGYEATPAEEMTDVAPPEDKEKTDNLITAIKSLIKKSADKFKVTQKSIIEDLQTRFSYTDLDDVSVGTAKSIVKYLETQLEAK